MQDYRWTQDWFYACRWIDPVHFENALRWGPFTHKQEYTYLTHKKLFPESAYSNNWALTPSEYRAKFEEMISLAPESKQLHWSSKYHNKHKNKGINRGKNYEY